MKLKGSNQGMKLIRMRKETEMMGGQKRDTSEERRKNTRKEESKGKKAEIEGRRNEVRVYGRKEKGKEVSRQGNKERKKEARKKESRKGTWKESGHSDKKGMTMGIK